MKILSIAAAITAVMTGCFSKPVVTEPISKSANTWVVTVGMEHSKIAGDCTGAGIDCSRMTKLLKNYSSNVVTFVSTNAIKANVVAAMKEAVANADLFIFYYSGHGGSIKADNALEVDGFDELLLFYDEHMMDDEIWDIITKAKGRVMLIFDACHSQTMYRAVPITLKSSMPLQATHVVSGACSLQVWSGCPDYTFSYGGASGGAFTNMLLSYMDATLTYDQLWKKIEDDSRLKKIEIVQRTKMGTAFNDKKIFR